MNENYKKLLKKDFSYPDLSKDDFQKKIYEKREFYYHKIPEQEKITNYIDLKKYRDNACESNFSLLSHQSLLANFINPQTPYKGLLICHGLGSGKTCAAIAICENFKSLVTKYHTKIYILVPGPLNKENWKDEIIKCTKEVYLKDVSTGMDYVNKNEISKSTKMAKNLALQYYKIMSYRGFYKKVLGQKIIEHVSNEGDISKIYRKTESGDYERDVAVDKIEDLNNTILVVDEAHHLTGNDYGLAVQKIIKNSKNLKVILLTATPMKNLADDIIEMINYLRPANDPIERDLIFTSEKNHLMKFKENGKEYFQRMCQGYISYYRGANPYTFAVQKDQGEIPSALLFTSLVRCKMSDFQLQVYNTVLEAEGDTLDRRSASVANFVFPSYSLETKKIFGTFSLTGINNIKNLLKSNKEKYLSTLANEFGFNKVDDINNIVKEYHKYKSLSGKIFEQPYLQFFSTKFNTCLNNLLNLVEPYTPNSADTLETSDSNNIIPASTKNIKPNGVGTAFVYSNLVKIGIELFEQVLLANGCLEYREDGIYNLYENTRDYLTGMSYKDFKELNITRKFYPTTYITITGASEESAEQIPEEKKKILDSVFSSIENVQGQYIKFILGSKVMTEGITIKQIKEIHVLDAAYHLGQLQQVIGRGIRFCVHNNISSEENPYPEVRVYRYVVSFDDPDKLTNEEILYQKAEKKYILVKETERLMKEVSIDCPLNYNGNIIKDEVDEYKDCVEPNEYEKLNIEQKKHSKQCPLKCDFKECAYLCYDKKLNLKYYDRTTKLYKKITKNNIDFSTFTNKLARNEIESCKDKIKEMYKYKYIYVLDEIVDIVKNSFVGEKKELFEPFFVYQALDELIPITENDFNNFHDNIYDKYNVPGYLIYRKKYYIFQPFNQNENVPMYYRHNYQTDLINQLSLFEYLKNIPEFNNFISKDILNDTVDNINKKILIKNEYNFNDVFEYYDKKDEFVYVGIIDKPLARKKTITEELEDVFKIREKRAKILDKKRGTGIPSLKGAVCYSSKDKKFLLKIAQKIGIIDIPKDSRINICKAIKYRLLYLEKFSREKDNNKFTYIIIPKNHPKYNFPFNLEDRIEYIKTTIEQKIPIFINISVKELQNGIFENVRDKKLPKYELKFTNKKEYDIYKQDIIGIGFILENNEWSILIE